MRMLYEVIEIGKYIYGIIQKWSAMISVSYTSVVMAGLIVCAHGGPVEVFVHAPAVVADMPAKAMVRNSVNFNGMYGCSLCTLQGQRVASGSGHCRAYMPQSGEHPVARTHITTLQHAEEAMLKKLPVKKMIR